MFSSSSFYRETHVDFQEGIVNFWRSETGFKMNEKCDLGGQYGLIRIGVGKIHENMGAIE